ncbi:MAG: hypothetical protein HY305_01865, partial [Sphingobacteriales bacterium]|nr:hypothetical protein [Sphingobacteriales bacterium]
MLIVVLLLAIIYTTIHITAVQTWIAKDVTGRLSNELHTKVSIQHIDIAFFDNLLLNNLLIEDLHKDTLLYAGTARVSIIDWFFLKDKPVLKYIGLEDAVVNMVRTDSVWNYQFIADYFSGGKKDTSAKGGIEIDLKIVQLKNIHFRRIDQWVGQDMHAGVKELSLYADDIDLAKKRISLNTLNLDAAYFSFSDYTGKRPHQPAKKDTIHIIEPYKWNNDGWILHVKNIHINNSVFTNDKETLDRAPYTDNH